MYERGEVLVADLLVDVSLVRNISGEELPCGLCSHRMRPQCCLFAEDFPTTALHLRFVVCSADSLDGSPFIPFWLNQTHSVLHGEDVLLKWYSTRKRIQYTEFAGDCYHTSYSLSGGRFISTLRGMLIPLQYSSYIKTLKLSSIIVLFVSFWLSWVFPVTIQLIVAQWYFFGFSVSIYQFDNFWNVNNFLLLRNAVPFRFSSSILLPLIWAFC